MRLVTSKFDEFSLTIPTGTVPFPVASGAAVEFPADVTAEAAGTEVCLRLTFSLEESRKLTWLTAWPLATGLRGMSSAELSSLLPLAWCTWWGPPGPPLPSPMGPVSVRSWASPPSNSMSTKNVLSQKWNIFSPFARFCIGLVLPKNVSPNFGFEMNSIFTSSESRRGGLTLNDTVLSFFRHKMCRDT